MVISFHDQGNLNPPVLNGSKCCSRDEDDEEQHAHMMHIKHSTTSFVIIGFAIITCAILCMNYYYFMLPKRRFWKDEQKMKCGFSKHFSRA